MAQSFEIDRHRLPREWPTHRCPPEFWEELGRTIAKLGFLEDCLKRAHLAITATKEYDSVEAAQAAFDAWEPALVRSMDETLGQLAQRFVEALEPDTRFTAGEVSEVDKDLNGISNWRNALCHGAWTDYDDHTGLATLRYWPRGRWDEDDQSERLVCRDNLAQIGLTTVRITVRIVNLVTRHGIQFPGDHVARKGSVGA